MYQSPDQSPDMIFRGQCASPLGEILLAWRVKSAQPILVALDFSAFETRFVRLITKRFGPKPAMEIAPIPYQIAEAVADYFTGNPLSIMALPWQGHGTPFQDRVWQQLRAIPCGETRSYSQVALYIGQPSAVRAVARANALNPIGIATPCHRVIGSNGELTGYAGGLKAKSWLLDHEKRILARGSSPAV